MEARANQSRLPLRALLCLAACLIQVNLVRPICAQGWIGQSAPSQIPVHIPVQRTITHIPVANMPILRPVAAAAAPRRNPFQRSAQRSFQAHTENFIVFASSQGLADEVAAAARQYRRDLAMHWLGKELPPWSQRCPIHVTVSPQLGASGETQFAPISTGVGNWQMIVNGTRERVLDSVLPHEISHTILATHFAKFAQRGQFVPRWADEGACTTVEAEAEKRKHRHYLVQFLQTGKGIAFNRMFQMKEYPRDILPLYAQGHSAVQFLIDQSDPQAFVRFLDSGMQGGSWQMALNQHYKYQSIGQFQQLWNQWLFDGSPDNLVAYAPKLQSTTSTPAMLASNQQSSPAQGLQLPSPPAKNGRSIPAQVAINPNAQAAAPTNFAIASRPVGESSWYRQRLQQVSGSNPAMPETTSSSNFDGRWQTAQSMSRPQEPQSIKMQVLDAGTSVPIRSGVRAGVGTASSSAAAPHTGWRAASSKSADAATSPMERVSALPAGHVGAQRMVPIQR
ncbi:MAG: hypothetical protein AB8B50_09510 [Pirellulaceae bacterium]